MYSIIDIDKINSTCRVCLHEGKSGVCMFEFQNDLIYCDLIKKYIGVDMVKNDNLPNMICDECRTELMVAVNFISKCHISIEKFEKALNPTKPLFDDVKLLLKKEEDDDTPLSNLHISIKEEFSDELDDCAKSPLDCIDELKSDEKNLKVDKPAKRFKRKKALLSKREWICSECKLVTSSRSALEVHIRTHTGERPFQCSSCEKSFAIKGTLKAHFIRLHMKDTSNVSTDLVCEVCGKICIKKSDLKCHLRIHTNEKPYPCPKCTKSFRQSGILAQHLRLHTGERPYACHKCVKRFNTSSALDSHMVSHSDEKNFKCKICEKHLKTKAALSHHVMFMHTSEKPFPCKVCGKSFILSKLLKLHMRAKHSEFSGTCQHCKKTFTNLTEHLRVHTGEKPFECRICQKRIATQRALTVHLMRHSNTTKFSCTFIGCSSEFPLEYQLKHHIIKVHDKVHTHVCDICSRGFFRNTDLLNHIAKKHSNKKGAFNQVDNS